VTAPGPARPPGRVTLEGRYGRLEPIGPQHARALWAATVPERFLYLFGPPPANEGEMAAWVHEAAAADDPLCFAVIDKATGRAEGRQALMRITPAHGVIEVGSIYWGPAIARTRVATEALYLHARHVFETLGYRRFEWKCDTRNEASKAAAQRFGFTFEGVFRQHMIIKGANRDTAWFAMLDSEWPRLRDGYERWLDPANFDGEGRQRSKLTFQRAAKPDGC